MLFFILASQALAQIYGQAGKRNTIMFEHFSADLSENYSFRQKRVKIVDNLVYAWASPLITNPLKQDHAMNL